VHTAPTEKKEKKFKPGEKKIVKPAADFNVENGVNQEMVIGGRELKFTNLDKLYWKKEGITKGDMLNYYAKIAPFILPYMKDRPQSMHRHPDGINGMSFFQKDIRGKVQEWMTTHESFSESTNETIEYLVCNDEATLLYMANLGCIEMHPWHSRKQKPDNPDYCLIDLDPDKNNRYEQVIEVANLIKQLMDDIGADCYAKTSGSTGMHIYIPLGAKYSYEPIKATSGVSGKSYQSAVTWFHKCNTQSCQTKRKNIFRLFTKPSIANCSGTLLPKA
jgi:bifunctional non-homologous end joining protein LigD